MKNCNLKCLQIFSVNQAEVEWRFVKEKKREKNEERGRESSLGTFSYRVHFDVFNSSLCVSSEW
jgi:hypothetical protein